MTDNTTPITDGGKLASQEYAVGDFAREYNISRGEASAMIERYGASRSKLDAIMAERLYG